MEKWLRINPERKEVGPGSWDAAEFYSGECGVLRGK